MLPLFSIMTLCHQQIEAMSSAGGVKKPYGSEVVVQAFLYFATSQSLYKKYQK